MTETRHNRGLGAVFGGVQTTLEEQREVWPEALHEDAIWEGPAFERPVCIVGREACGRFFEFLLEVVPRFTTKVVAVHPTPDPETAVVEMRGGGDTVDGGRYEQRYLSVITSRDGRVFRMREYLNPYRTIEAFGRERWESRTDEIMRKHNVPWPKSQPPDPASP